MTVESKEKRKGTMQESPNLHRHREMLKELLDIENQVDYRLATYDPPRGPLSDPELDFIDQLSEIGDKKWTRKTLDALEDLWYKYF